MTIASVLAGIARGFSVTLANVNSNSPFTDQGGPTHEYRVRLDFNSDGTLDVDRLRNTNTLGIVWGTGGVTGLYLRLTVTAGTMTSGTTGSWLQMNATRSFTKSYTPTGPAPDTESVTFTVDIATDSGGSNIIATQTGLVIEVGEAI